MHKHRYWGSIEAIPADVEFVAIDTGDDEIFYTDILDHHTPEEATACAVDELERTFILATGKN